MNADKRDKRNRIPASELADLANWNLPSVGEGKSVNVIKKRTLGKENPYQAKLDSGVTIEDVSSEELSSELSQAQTGQVQSEQTKVEDITLEEALTESVMSADALEKIANEAHEEGFSAGHEEGVEKGFQEGLIKGHEEGHAKGHQEGYEAGLVQAKAEAKELSDQVLSQQVQQLQYVMQRLIEPTVNREETIEGLMLNLLRQVVKAVIGHEAKTDHSILTNLVNEAVNALPVNAQDVIIYLNPDDARLIQEYVSLKKEWQIGSDPSIDAGGCRVETTQSQIDNTLENRLTQVFEQLLGRKENPVQGDVIDRNVPKSQAGLTAFLDGVQTSDNWDEQQALQNMMQNTEEETHMIAEDKPLGDSPIVPSDGDDSEP